MRNTANKGHELSFKLCPSTRQKQQPNPNLRNNPDTKAKPNIIFKRNSTMGSCIFGILEEKVNLEINNVMIQAITITNNNQQYAHPSFNKQIK